MTVPEALHVRLFLVDCGSAGNGHPAPAVRRLARLLKALRRGYGFQILRVEEVCEKEKGSCPR